MIIFDKEVCEARNCFQLPICAIDFNNLQLISDMKFENRYQTSEKLKEDFYRNTYPNILWWEMIWNGYRNWRNGK